MSSILSVKKMNTTDENGEEVHQYLQPKQINTIDHIACKSTNISDNPAQANISTDVFDSVSKEIMTDENAEEIHQNLQYTLVNTIDHDAYKNINIRI